MNIKCTCKGLLAFAGGIAMISSAAVASPDLTTPTVDSVNKDSGAKMAVTQSASDRVSQEFAGMVSLRGEVTCPAGAIDENEPLIPDFGDDVTNGGCFMDSPAYTSFAIGETGCGQINTYEVDGGLFNTDTDWWQFTVSEATEVELTLSFSGHPQTQIGITTNDCSAPAFVPPGGWNVGEAGSPFTTTYELAPGTYNVFVRTGPDGGLTVPEGYSYVIGLAVAGQTPGACCDAAGNCVDTIEADCNTAFTPNVTCAEVTCATIDECPAGGNVEGFGGGEVLADGYTDGLNSGCNAPGGKAFDGFAPLNCGETVCGTSGVHENADGGLVRDQDWFRFETVTDAAVSIDFAAAFNGQIVIGRLNSDGSCPDSLAFGFVQAFANVDAGSTVTLDAVLAAGSYAIWAQPQPGQAPFLNLPYQWTITTCGPVTAPVGCCFEDGSCQDLLPSACDVAGGSFQQDVCAEIECPIVAANNNFEGALPVVCGETFVADLATALPGAEFPFDCGFGTAHTNTLWYSFEATDTFATVSTCGVGNAIPADDSTIDVWSFDGTNLTEVGCGEDDCTAAGGGPFLSIVELEGLTIGETYYIRIGAWDPTDVAAYNVELTCEKPEPPVIAENDTFDGALPILCDETLVADLTTASQELAAVGDGFPFACRATGPGGFASLWYSFVADGPVATITTCGLGNVAPAIDSLLDAYSFDGTTLTEIGCNDDDCTEGAGFLSTLELTGLTDGETYYFRIASWGTGNVGAYNVQLVCGEIEPPVFAENDTFDGAISVNCDSTFFADIREASPGFDSDGFPFACRITGAGGTNTLWYSFVATGDAATITTCASTAPAAQDSILDAYSFDGTTLTEIGCNDDDETCDFFLSTLELTGLTVGETYYIRIGAWGTGSLDEYQVDIACASGCDASCADATGEGNVNLDDLNVVLTNFGQTVTVGTLGDVDCSGNVNLDDLNLVLTQFGSTCN